MYSLLQNIHTWLVLAFVIIVVYLFYKLRAIVVNFLNSKVEEIKDNIKESEDILQEAISALAEKQEELKKSSSKNKNTKSEMLSRFESNFEQSLSYINIKNKNYKSAFDSYVESEKKEHAHSLKQLVINDSIEVVTSYCSNLTDKEHQQLIDASIKRIKSVD